MLAAIAVMALAAAGCFSGSPPTTAEGGQVGSPAAGGQSWKGVCPDTVVVQTNWWPQAEYGALYRLLGAKPTVDAGRKTVTSALVDAGVDTGVDLTVRAGGPANNFTPAAQVLYTDKSVMLAGSDLDAAVAVSATRPVLGVFAPMDIAPLVLMWDQAAYPTVNTIADIGQTDAKVLYFQGAAYMQYLIGAGILKASQVSASYQGTPDQFRAARGTAVQQGFLTNEVLTYPQDTRIWGKPVSYELIADTGYPVYQEMLVTRPDRKAEFSRCLRKLVPALQRASVAYAADPGPTNLLLSQLVSKLPGAYPYPKEHADEASRAMLFKGVIGNGANKVIGDVDEDRVRRIITITTPILTSQRTKVKPGLAVEDLTTNEFIDQALGLPAR
jgi:hypothetical protein